MWKDKSQMIKDFVYQSLSLEVEFSAVCYCFPSVTTSLCFDKILFSNLIFVYTYEYTGLLMETDVLLSLKVLL